ncbi:MAG: YgaP-like transmembrane domain [Patescibacteria group bacterium]
MLHNLNRYERVVRLFLSACSFFAAIALFTSPLARILAAGFGVYVLGECFLGYCPVHVRLGVKSPADRLAEEKRYLLGLCCIQLVMAYEWWGAGLEKVSSPVFVEKIDKTLVFFASQNPHPWYASYLNAVVMPNAAAFAYAVEWSQVFIAVALAVTAIRLLYRLEEATPRWLLPLAFLALAGGMLMNANFYFAAAWTGPAVSGENMTMFWTQAMLAYVWMGRMTAERKKHFDFKSPA